MFFIISVYLCVLSVSVVYHSEIFTTEAQSTRRNTELIFDNYVLYFFIISVYLCVLSVSVVYHLEIFTTEAQSTRRNTELMFDNYVSLYFYNLCVSPCPECLRGISFRGFYHRGTEYTKEQSCEFRVSMANI
jgi:hypothetical protein